MTMTTMIRSAAPARRFATAATAAALALGAASALAADAPKPGPVTLQARACPADVAALHGATCLQALVPEDHAKPDGRRIGLDIVMLKAGAAGAGNPAHRPPLFILQGGPGDRTTLSAAREAKVWATFGRTHDLVFVDQRGNGTTPDLSCPSADEATLMTQLWPSAPLAACARALATHADLARYTTTDAARDVDDVRAALGYAQIDIVGYSYGTRLTQELLRRDSAAVHAALLLGPMAPAATVPAGIPRSMDRSMAQVLALCDADATCHAAFPDIDGDLAHLRDRFAHGPLVLRRAAGGDLALAPGVVASYLRMYLYAAEGAATVPARVHALADPARDQAELGAIADWRRDFETWAPVGQYLAITCAEDVPFIDADAERRAAAGTLMGAYRLDRQVDACRAWPRAAAGPALHTPVATATPTLALVGEFDPATPTELAPDVVASMTHGRVIVVPRRGHALGEDWDACVGPLATAFLETGDEQHVGTACLAGLRMPAFATSSDAGS